MKKETVNKVIGNIDEDLIESADTAPAVKQKNSAFLKWAAAAASFFIVFAVLMTVNYSVKNKGNEKDTGPVITDLQSSETVHTAETDTANTSESDTEPGEEKLKEKDWEKKLIYEKYTELFFGDEIYSPFGYNETPGLQAAEKLYEKAKLDGQCGDTIKETTADVYSIKNVLPGCMVIVRFENEKDCIYFNRSYYADTLGDMIDDLYLKVSLCVGYGYTPPVFDDTGKLIEELKTYDKVYKDEVLSLLKQNENAKNKANRSGENDIIPRETLILIEISTDGTLHYRYSLSVTEDGYLITNILSRYNIFEIGKENAKAFAAAIISRGAQQPETAAETPSEIPE